MGHKKKGVKSPSLHTQAYNVITGMLNEGLGRSKKDDKSKGVTFKYIYSVSTYKSYMRHIDYYLGWLKRTHPEVTTLTKAKKYVKEWLESREATGKYSAYTLQLETAALAKLFGISPDDRDRYIPPARHRNDIIRSRCKTKSDAHFSEKKNELLVTFCRSTGLRREGLTSIKSDCLIEKKELPGLIESLKMKKTLTERESALVSNYEKTKLFKNADYFIFVKEKGGKWRYAPVIGDVDAVVRKIKSTPPGKRVWQHVSKSADVHGYRADYAAAIYKMYAREPGDIPYDAVNAGSGRKYQSELYVCRGDMSGVRLDRRAMLTAEKALGHESLHTFASHYAYKI